MMENSNLVAMIPVDQRWANEEMHWDHPAEKLLGRLKEKTRGRVIRTDQIPSGNEPPQKPNEATDRDWQSFITQLEWDHSSDRLWVQSTRTWIAGNGTTAQPREIDEDMVIGRIGEILDSQENYPMTAVAGTEIF